MHDIRRGEFVMSLTLIDGLGPSAPLPELDACVIPADLDFVVRDLAEDPSAP